LTQPIGATGTDFTRLEQPMGEQPEPALKGVGDPGFDNNTETELSSPYLD
jgi:hypothetical protein